MHRISGLFSIRSDAGYDKPDILLLKRPDIRYPAVRSGRLDTGKIRIQAAQSILTRILNPWRAQVGGYR